MPLTTEQLREERVRIVVDEVEAKRVAGTRDGVASFVRKAFTLPGDELSALVGEIMRVVERRPERAERPPLSAEAAARRARRKKEVQKPAPPSSNGVADDPRRSYVRNIPGLGSRTKGALHQAGINRVGNLLERSDAELRAMPYVTDKAMGHILTFLQEHGLELAPDSAGAVAETVAEITTPPAPKESAPERVTFEVTPGPRPPRVPTHYDPPGPGSPAEEGREDAGRPEAVLPAMPPTVSAGSPAPSPPPPSPPPAASAPEPLTPAPSAAPRAPDLRAFRFESPAGKLTASELEPGSALWSIEMEGTVRGELVGDLLLALIAPLVAEATS
jgi:hypothetical protein